MKDINTAHFAFSSRTLLARTSRDEIVTNPSSNSTIAEIAIMLVLFLTATVSVATAEGRSATSGPLINSVSASVASIGVDSGVPNWLTSSEPNITVFSSTVSGNWGDSTTWGGTGVPGPADNVIIAAGTIVTLDMNRAVHGVTINQSAGLLDSGRLELNGNQLDLQGSGAFFTHNGNLTNSNATLGTLAFVGNGTPGGITQFLQSNSGCSFANPCNLQLRLTNAVIVKNIAGQQFFNIGLTIDPSAVLDLTDELRFLGNFERVIPIVNGGAIQNGRLTTERLVSLANNGNFDSDLVVNPGTTTTRGDMHRLVGIQSTGNLVLNGELRAFAALILDSGGTLNLSGHAIQFVGNNATFLNRGSISNSGSPNTIFFVGNGSTGGVTQHLMANGGTFASNLTERCSNNVTLILDEDTQLGNINVDSGSSLNIGNHTLSLTGPGVAMIVQGTMLSTASTIEMRGTAPQSVQTNLSGAAYNNLTINNAAGVDIPNPGANPLTIPGTLTLAAGTFTPNGNLTVGNGATIARSGGSLAAAPIFGSTVNIRYFGFVPISTGVEMPLANLLNNLSVDTIGTTTVTLNSDVVVNGNFFLAQGATLTGPPNKSLILKGLTVSSQGTVTHPSVVFNSPGVQTLDGNGTWTGSSVAMVGTGSVSLLNPINFTNGLFTNASTINTGTNFLTFHGGAFTNNGVINGNFQTDDSNVALDAGTTGFNAAFRIFSGTTTAKGRINSSLTVQSPVAILQVVAGETLTVTGSATINGPLSGAGTFRTNGSTISNSALVSVAAFQFGGTSQSLAGTGSFAGNTATILSGSSTTLGANKQMSSIVVDAGGSFSFSNRTLLLSGSGTPFTNAGSYAFSNSTVEYNGTVAQTLSSTIPTYFNLSLNNTVGTTGFAGLTVNSLLRVKSGTFTSSGGTNRDIQIDSGAAMVGTAGTNISVSGNWANNAAFTANGNIVNFNGAGAQLLGGTSGTVFDNLSTSGGSSVNLGQNVSVNSLLTLGTDLSTGVNTLTMPSTATSFGTADVIGNVKRIGFVGGGTALSFGNPNNSIAFAAAGALPSDITLNLVKSIPSGFPTAVRRIYTITPSGGSGFSATVRLHYLDSELNGNFEPNLGLFRFSNGSWEQQGAPANDTLDNWVEQSGITQFSTWAIGARKGKTTSDFDGDGKSDVAVYRESEGNWYYLNSLSNTFGGVHFGAVADRIVPGDYDGDRKTDFAVWRPSDGTWYLQQSTAGFSALKFGLSTDLPAQGDFDGDGKTDIAVFRPSEGIWYLQQSTAGFAAVQFGANGDRPVPGDYDGDGKTDVGVFRPSEGNWYLLQSTAGFGGYHFGIPTDKVVPADFDGDGKTDLGVYRDGAPGVWFLLQSQAGFNAISFGTTNDIPAPGDFDGDGKADTTVFRPSNGIWFSQQTTSGFVATQFGQNGDKPVPAGYVPVQ